MKKICSAALLLLLTALPIRHAKADTIDTAASIAATVGGGLAAVGGGLSAWFCSKKQNEYKKIIQRFSRKIAKLKTLVSIERERTLSVREQEKKEDLQDEINEILTFTFGKELDGDMRISEIRKQLEEKEHYCKIGKRVSVAIAIFGAFATAYGIISFFHEEEDYLKIKNRKLLSEEKTKKSVDAPMPTIFSEPEDGNDSDSEKKKEEEKPKIFPEISVNPSIECNFEFGKVLSYHAPTVHFSNSPDQPIYRDHK